MKILVIANCEPDESLGSGYVIKNFTEGLIQAGHKVDFFGPDALQFLAVLHPRANQYRMAYGMLRLVKREVSRKHYDLVEFWGGESFLAIKYLRSRFNRSIKIVHHTNGPEPKYEEIYRRLYPGQHKWFQFRKGKLMEPAFSLPDLLITVSQDDLFWLEKNNLPTSGMRTSISPALPADFIATPFQVKKAKRIGFCGTWLPKKGIAVIKDVIPKILRQFPDWKFVIIGQPSSFSAADHFPPDVLSSISVIPFIRNKEELRREYLGLDIFFLPSLHESFGLVMAEAMACGCTLVTSKVGFAHELVNEEHALVIDSHKSDDFEKALMLLLEDQELRRKIARSGHEFVQTLTWEESQKMKNDLIEEIMA